MPGDSFYVTTPIYYVNGLPHIGHAYTSIVADAAARWQRLKGRPTRFLTGTDEHGQKVLEAAQARGLSPKDHVDALVVVWKATMDRLQIRYDRFIRTTDPDHEALVRRVLQQLWDAGEIYQDAYEGWYHVRDEVFVTDKDRTERLANGAGEDEFRRITETNYFFRMSKYQTALLDHIEANPDFIQPDNRRNEVKGFLRQPLGDLCISRPKSRMGWGIELPFDADFVCYVWFDALLNYVTGTGYPEDGWEQWWPVDYHLIGKDILTTHAVYWTTMLLALDIPLPEHLFAHGWWVSGDGEKMSKSAGNTIDIALLCDAFGVDAARYFFLREIRLGADGAFSYEGFLTRYNADLANDLGNLAHRALSMTTRWIGPQVPERDAADRQLSDLASATVRAVDGHFDALRFKEALEALWELVKAGNKHIDTTEPWAMNKAGDEAGLARVMRDVLEVCAVAAILLQPVMPTKAAELLAKVGLTPEAAWAKLAQLLAGGDGLGVLAAGAPIELGDPLFPRFRQMPEAIAALFAPEETVESEEIALPELEWIEYPGLRQAPAEGGARDRGHRSPQRRQAVGDEGRGGRSSPPHDLCRDQVGLRSGGSGGPHRGRGRQPQAPQAARDPERGHDSSRRGGRPWWTWSPWPPTPATPCADRLTYRERGWRPLPNPLRPLRLSL